MNDDDVLAQGLEPWSDLPLWIPERDAESGGMLLASNRRALAAGLTLRPLRDTVADTLQWAGTNTTPPSVVALSPELEQQCLQAAAAAAALTTSRRSSARRRLRA